ncbi:leukotriene B4 receptor 1 [Gadus chalcogrammus]|uniref:leukotriene B4 receptor 1 n=1 Tax=Gadus chalcogrammus TaxID=1042646 RepID=UPI0024C48D31|nr:leukotriene B4 receptor 1 [Gadus chalcogrammus]
MAFSPSQLYYASPYTSSSLVSPFSLNLSSTATPSAALALTPAPQRASAALGVAILVLAFVLGFPGNLFVVWSVWWRVKKRSVTCLLVMNLAAADALVLLSAPLFLRYLLGGRGWEFGAAACKLVHYLSSVNMYVSIYSIGLMSADRCLAVTRPFLAHRLRTKRKLLGLLLGLWALSFLLSLPMPFYRSKQQIPIGANRSVPICNQDHGNGVEHRVFQYLFETVMGFLVPFAFIVGCYGVVVNRLRTAMFQKKGQSSRLILLIVGAFGLFWLPYHVINVMEIYGVLQGDEAVVRAAEQGRPTLTAFAYFSSAVNPILYVFAGSSHIRAAGLSFMGRLFEGTNSESRTTSTTNRTRSSRGGSTAVGVMAAAAAAAALEEEGSPLRAVSAAPGPAAGGGKGGRHRSEFSTLATIDQSE